MRRSSAIINPVTAAAAVEDAAAKRRSNSWSLSDAGDHSSDDDEASASLAEQLTGQRWHEVGNAPPPVGATDDFDVMVDQLSSVLSSRLRDLLVYWMNPLRHDVSAAGEDAANKDGAASVENRNKAMAIALECLELDDGDYILEQSISNSMREYVTCIGRLYHRVGFHSFEHCAHVTLSMNKLLSLIHRNRRDHLKKRTSEYKVHTHSAWHAHGGASLSFGIAEDPRILFAMVFAALIHDVGHTGVPNLTLVEEEDDLAIQHNDVSVAEQNSLRVAFSLLQTDEFAPLKRCICPTPEERKFFRKKVICMVMVTDISDQERVQIVASRWNAAFPPAKEGGEESDGEGQDGGGAPGAARNRRTEIQSPELRASIQRRRITMFSSDAAAEEFAKLNRSRRLGIRTSMDFSGMLLDAYSTTDQLQQHAVLETMMNVADVAHTMQSFAVFVKWNRRLFKEFYAAHLCGRLAFDPSENWYENQIGFFSHYILPLSQKMKACGAFGTTGNVFEYFAGENKKRWTEEGEEISERIIREVREEGRENRE